MSAEMVAFSKELKDHFLWFPSSQMIVQKFQGKTVVQKYIVEMMDQIANYYPTISRNTIEKVCTSIKCIADYKNKPVEPTSWISTNTQEPDKYL